MRNSTEIKQQAAGLWRKILPDLAPTTSLAVSNTRKHFPCPIHGGQNGFRAFNDVSETGGTICATCGANPDGFATLMWVNEWDFPTAVQAVDQYLNGSTGKHLRVVYRAPTNHNDPQAELRRQQRIDATLAACQRMNWPLAKYLEGRGLGAVRNRVPPTIRAHIRLPYFEDGKLIAKHPAMVAPFTDLDGNVVSVHRTYLTDRGQKAPVTSPRKIMAPAKRGSLNGCAIRLFEPAKKMAVCEGIETALAVHLMTGLPVIATGSAGLMRTVLLPDSVRRVEVYADRDVSGTGEEAARHLVSRLTHCEGREARILLPKGPIPDGAKSLDWLDVYLRQQQASA